MSLQLLAFGGPCRRNMPRMMAMVVAPVSYLVRQFVRMTAILLWVRFPSRDSSFKGEVSWTAS